jgi:mannose-6-phosphate isomerase class I
MSVRREHHGADVWVVLSGEARLSWNGGELSVRPGVPALVPAALGGYTVACVGGEAPLAFRASERT